MPLGDVDHVVPMAQNDHADPANQLATPREVAIRMSASRVAPTSRLQTILVQLKTMIANPAPGIVVYPFRDQIDVWRVLLRGPDESVYRRQWWYLTIEFPRGYPHTPPLIRFVHPPFHPNVSNEGSICINTLAKGYRRDSKIYEILLSILELLANPNYEDPIDAQRATMWKEHPGEFQQKVLKSLEMNSRRTVDEWVRGWQIEEDDPAIELDVHEYEIPKVFA
jgi:ubiquitin-protein ligase